MSIELTTISNSLNGPEKIDKVLTQVRLTCTSVSKERDVPGQTGTGRPVIPLSRDKKVLPVPLSRKVALSRPVGNPNFASCGLQNNI